MSTVSSAEFWSDITHGSFKGIEIDVDKLDKRDIKRVFELLTERG